MTRAFLTRSVVGATVVLFAWSSVVGAALLPPEELDRLAGATNYKAATTALNAVLSLNRKCKAAAPYDFVHVWTLLATVELDQGHFDRAALTAKKGAAEAQASGQVQDGAESMALSCFVIRSRNGVYTVRSGNNKGKQYNVVDPAVRKDGYADLFVDELDALQNDRWQAQCTSTIDPALAAADKFVAVRALERVASGNTTQTDDLGRQAAAEARSIIDGYINEQNGDLADIDNDAKTVIVAAQRAVATGHVRHPAIRQVLRGLTPDERKQVTAVAAATAKIGAAVVKMNAGFGVPEAFTNLHKPARDLNRLANRLLTQYPT